MTDYLKQADLSMGFYDLSCTTALGNNPLIYDETTLKSYLQQVAHHPDFIKLNLELKDYGHKYILAFSFEVQTIPTIEGRRKKMMAGPTALPREIVKNNLPSQQDYGFRSGEKNPIYSGTINGIEVREVPEVRTGSVRHVLKGDLQPTQGRLSLKEKYGFEVTYDESPSAYIWSNHKRATGLKVSTKRMVPSDTHKLHENTTATRKKLREQGYTIKTLEYEPGFYTQTATGQISDKRQSNKTALGFSEDRLKKTKTKISWGGSSKVPTHLPECYAYASRYYKYSKKPKSRSKVRFLVMNSRHVYYQVDNHAPVALASFTTITRENGNNHLICKLNDNINLDTSNEKLCNIWDKCIPWADSYLLNLSLAVDPVNHNEVVQRKKKVSKSIKSASSRLDAKIRKLQKK